MVCKNHRVQFHLSIILQHQAILLSCMSPRGRPPLHCYCMTPLSSALFCPILAIPYITTNNSTIFQGTDVTFRNLFKHSSFDVTNLHIITPKLNINCRIIAVSDHCYIKHVCSFPFDILQPENCILMTPMIYVLSFLKAANLLSDKSSLSL